MLAATEGNTPRLVRDRAILWLFAALGLRAGEVVSLDLGHYERGRDLLWVQGKGRRSGVACPTGDRPPERMADGPR